MSEIHRITVGHPGRLDRVLHALLVDTDASRSTVAAWIRDGRVLVNETQVTKTGFAVSDGDVIQVEIPVLSEGRNIDCREMELDVVYEDTHLAVVNKPAGIAVHPAPTVTDVTMVDILRSHLNSLSDVAGSDRAGIVHRLDRETSGLLIVAKDNRTHNLLTDMFQARRIVKVYKAIAYGRVRDDEGTFDFPIGRSASDRKKMAVRRDGREAVTHFKTMERMGLFTILNLSLETGRTHQIRVHLTHAGHPIVGDKLYGATRWKTIEPSDLRKLAREFPRHALHAALIRFVHPITGNEIQLKQKLPGDLADLVEKLRQFQ